MHSRFPYPIYVVSKEDISSKQVIVLKEESEIPRYFQILEEKRGGKESLLASKIDILRTKINNTPVEEKLELISKGRGEVKELFMVSREAQYYEDLLELMGESYDKRRDS